MQDMNQYSAAGSAYQAGTLDAVAQQRHRVLRNTYALLALSLIPTVVGAFAGLYTDFSFLRGSPIVGSLVMLAVMMGLMWGVSATRNSGMGVVLLLAFTFVAGWWLGPMLQHALHLRNGGVLIGTAAAGTAAVFFTMAGIATVTKKDFSFLGNFLMIGVVVLFLASLGNLFFQMPALALTISAVAVLLFSALILFDVSRIINGGETNYVMATLGLYLDAYNIFVHLLNLLMAFTGDRD